MAKCPSLESVAKNKAKLIPKKAKNGHREKFGFKKVRVGTCAHRAVADAPIVSHSSLWSRLSYHSFILSFFLFFVDIAELDGGKVATIHFPNPNDLTSFDVSICPDSGYWKHATYHFTFTIPPHYPHSPPKVECKTTIYHPNIDLEGKVCLNILREDWKPVLDINSVIYGLIYLFYEPNPDDPLNHEAAELFRKDVRQFERLVSRTLRGGILDGVQFERLV